MKSLRICGCLLLCASYLTFVACKRTEKVSLPMLYKITITSCVPNIDTQSVHDSDQVEWVPDAPYQIMFLPTSTPTGPKVPTAQNPFQINPGVSVPKVITGPTNCSSVGCYFKYDIYRVTNGIPEPLPCLDPGIRIVPLHTTINH